MSPDLNKLDLSKPDLSKLVIALAAAVALAGCARLPYSPDTQSKVAATAAGAAAGAALAGDEDELLGAVLGAAAGYVIGANVSLFGTGNDKAFDQAVNAAKANPTTVEDVYDSTDADLNNDGLVTQDELIAMSNAGLSPQQILDRLKATNQVFYVNYQQRQALLDAGVAPDVVYKLEDINRA